MVNVAIGIVKKEDQIKQYSEIWKYYNRNLEILQHSLD